MTVLAQLAVFGVILTFSVLPSVTSQGRERGPASPDCCHQCRTIDQSPPRRPLPLPTCGKKVSSLNREISVLKSALNSQTIEVRLVSPKIHTPISQKAFKGVRDRLINVLKKIPFEKGNRISMYSLDIYFILDQWPKNFCVTYRTRHICIHIFLDLLSMIFYVIRFSFHISVDFLHSLMVCRYF